MNDLSTRRDLAKAITLIESARVEDQIEARALLSEIMPKTGTSMRVGITGTPGVGKSTFIEALGLHIISQGLKVAVLAVDPSSTVTGGSILGDKTRMQKLSENERAFIRPSPSSGALGGVARRTREAMLICEAAGYDVMIVETVGVGQSETEVAGMVDLFLLLLAPAGGDELQGIKKGIVELADLIIVNKADGELLTAAKRAQAEYHGALNLVAPAEGEGRQILLASALEGRGIAEVWQALQSMHDRLKQNGLLAQKRAHQSVAWMWKLVEDGLKEEFLRGRQALIAEIETAVREGTISPTEGMERLLDTARTG